MFDLVLLLAFVALYIFLVGTVVRLDRKEWKDYDEWFSNPNQPWNRRHI